MEGLLWNRGWWFGQRSWCVVVLGVFYMDRQDFFCRGIAVLMSRCLLGLSGRGDVRFLILSNPVHPVHPCFKVGKWAGLF